AARAKRRGEGLSAAHRFLFGGRHVAPRGHYPEPRRAEHRRGAGYRPERPLRCAPSRIPAGAGRGGGQFRVFARQQ
nr:hypothetical protein [Tanacetum cinerariifolium]